VIGCDPDAAAVERLVFDWAAGPRAHSLRFAHHGRRFDEHDRRMLEDLLALVAPPACAVCEEACEVRRRLCDRCERGLRGQAPVLSAVPGIDATWSAAPYDGTARRLVGSMKFRSRLGLAEDAASIIAGRAPSRLLAGAIVPVPAAPARLRRRGFDAAEAIAVQLAKRTGFPVAPCLSRTQSARQVGRRRAERLVDPPAVQAVSPVPTEAVLVDDVMTTGATLGACAAALRSAGAARVVAVTLAASKPGRGPLGAKARAA
jgi:ComF family protein